MSANAARWGGGGGAATTGLRERGNDTSKSTGRSGRQNAATRRNMRREERVTVQGPVKEQHPDGMSHRGAQRKTICKAKKRGVPRMSVDTYQRAMVFDVLKTARYVPGPTPLRLHSAAWPDHWRFEVGGALKPAPGQ